MTTQAPITVTQAAADKIKELLSHKEDFGTDFKPETAGVRVFVRGGGCSGFEYGLNIEIQPNDTDNVFESNGIRIFVDPISIRYLSGSEIDYTDDLVGGGFKVNNPNAKSTCGCGQSFEPK